MPILYSTQCGAVPQLHYTTVPYITVQYSTVHYAIPYRTDHYSTQYCYAVQMLGTDLQLPVIIDINTVQIDELYLRRHRSRPAVEVNEGKAI